MQMKLEWSQYPGSLGDLSQDLDDVLPSDLEIFPSLNSLGFDDDFCADLDEINCLMMDDLSCPDARELRNHDCMWAGLCVNEKHERDSLRPEKVIMPTPPRKRPPVVAPTSARSLLLPTRLPPDRPDTPLSENELDFDFPGFCDVLEELSPVGPTEVTGQVCRPVPPPQPSRILLPTNNDHCYFTTIIPETMTDNVKTDCLGVQTPSDSEEEIDVETVVADPRKPGRSTVSGSVLPNSPSLMDRHQLQLTVASAMHGKDSSRRSATGAASATPRYVLDKNDRTLDACRRRTVARKRRLSGDDYAGDYGRKLVKRKQYRRYKAGKAKRRRRVYVRNSGSSDSELDTTERRSMHNNMERQRRIDLRNAFEELRLLLPDTMDREKAAKVVILNSGSQYCRDLEHMEQKLMTEKATLRRHQERLREEVSRLRRSLAMRR